MTELRYGYTTPTEVKKIHDGEFWFIKTWADVDGLGTETYFMFTTPDTTTRVHAKVAIGAEHEFTVEIYEGGTYSDPGSAITPINANRNSANTPELSPYAGPTVTGDGTLIWASKVGAGRDAGVNVGLGYEIIAKQNEVYLFKITKNVAGVGYLDIDFFWYED